MAEKNIKFISYDGYHLEGTLNSAPNENAAVLFVHGITSSRDELGFHSDYAKFLSENKISSLRFDYRYHGVFETDSLVNLTLCGIVNDIEASYVALRENISNKVKKIFIIGTSFGGGLAVYWANFYNRKEVKKIILNAPVINYENDVLERNGFLKDGILSNKGKIELEKNGYVNSSDIHFGRGLINELKYVNGIKSLQDLGDKVTIFHGKDDEDVPIESSIKYKSSKTKLIKIDKVGHGFGIEIDEDLTHPETKKIHNSIYKKALRILKK
jgi:esterase/lipase